MIFNFQALWVENILPSMRSGLHPSHGKSLGIVFALIWPVIAVCYRRSSGVDILSEDLFNALNSLLIPAVFLTFTKNHSLFFGMSICCTGGLVCFLYGISNAFTDGVIMATGLYVLLYSIDFLLLKSKGLSADITHEEHYWE